MPDVKISALPAGAALTGTEEIPIVQSATTKRTTAQDIANLAPVGGDVTGPAGSTNNNFASFNGTTGKVIKDSGSSAASFDAAGAATTAQTNAEAYTDAQIAAIPDATNIVKGKAKGDGTTINSVSGNLSVIPNVLFHPGFVSGSFYACPGSGGTLSNQPVAANTLYFVPFFCPYAVTFTSIACYVNTLAAGTSCELGIYANNNGNPSSLLYDAGTVSSATTGVKALSGSFALNPGWCWLAIASDGTPSIGNSPVNPISSMLMGFTTQNISTTGVNWARKQSWTFSAGALPANASGITNETVLHPWYITLGL